MAKFAILFLTALLGPCAASAAEAAVKPASHAETLTALSLVGKPKYPAGFRHLDYVNPKAPKGGTLRLANVGGFDSLNPFIIRGNTPPGLSRVYETLMASTPDDISSEYGLIAKSVEIAANRSWVIFNLRPTARFDDGTPITSADVLWSFDTLKRNGAPQYRFYYANVAKAEILGPERVKFSFSGMVNRDLPEILGELPVLSSRYFATHVFNRTTLKPPLGSGPYRVSQVDPNRSITYERVANYWGRDLPINIGRYNFNHIRYESFRDSTVALEAFKAHTYDFRIENVAKNWATAYDFPALRKGLVIKQEIRERRPSGMQAFVFNTRLAKFADRRVREAIADAFDFQWENKHLFYDQYTRTNSFFANSDLAAKGLPSKAETKLLAPFRSELPPKLFTEPFEPAATDGSGNDRANLLKATHLLAEAGWHVRGGRLIGPKGQPFRIEFLLVEPEFERVVAPFIQNLKRLGIAARMRLVDPAQYENRLNSFAYDIIVAVWPESESPGNEQRNYWTSASAERPGSQNYAGIRSPVVDALVNDLIAAPDRAAQVAAARALDRVLLWNYYVIPQWHLTFDRIAYWNEFGRPKTPPKYGVDINAWWYVPRKAMLIRQDEGAGQR